VAWAQLLLFIIMMTTPLDRKNKSKKAVRYRSLPSSKNLKMRDYAKKVAQIITGSNYQGGEAYVVPTEGKIKVIVSNASDRRLLRRELKAHRISNVEFQSLKSIEAREPFLRCNGIKEKRVSKFADERAEALRIMLATEPTEEDRIAEANFVASLNGVAI
jgi:hypothetical protein